jgi:MOSC domain-containing protein YiiM
MTDHTLTPETIHLAAVNVGTPTPLGAVRGQTVWSAIRKDPVDPSKALWLSLLNLAGDGQADLSVHGGIDKAVYAYPSEHRVAWRAELEAELGDASFGENLETLGVLEHQVRIGDVWAWGESRLQVTQPRWPCFKLALHLARPDVQKWMRSTGRTGWYLRVLEVGEVPAAGPITVAADPADVTVEDAHLARTPQSKGSRP